MGIFWKVLLSKQIRFNQGVGIYVEVIICDKNQVLKSGTKAKDQFWYQYWSPFFIPIFFHMSFRFLDGGYI